MKTVLTPIGDALVRIMNEERIYSVFSMEPMMVQAASEANALPACKEPHPLNYARYGSQKLLRDGRFDVTLSLAHDSRGRSRKLRLYTLKEEYRQKEST